MGNSPKEHKILLANWKDVNGNRWRVKVDFKTIDGRQMPVELCIEALNSGYALSQNILRALPIARAVDMYFQDQGLNVPLKEPSRAKRINKEYSDEELKFVASIYRSAFAVHMPVQATVAQERNIPISTAAKQIAAARKRGFLGSATRSRPGERPGMNERGTKHGMRIDDCARGASVS